METLESRTNLIGSYLWAGLIAYVVAVDMYALLSEKETLSDACTRMLGSPIKRWAVIAAWGLTTKHLFVRNVVPWLDPFAAMAGTAKIIKHKEKDKWTVVYQ